MQSLLDNRLFSALNPAEIQQISQGGRVLSRGKGAHLFYQGDILNHYYFLESGHVRLYRLGYDGQEKVFREIENGTVFAETIIFSPERRAPLSAVVNKKSRIVELDANLMVDLCRVNSEFSASLMALMAESLQSAVNRIDQLTVNKATQRLVLYLADLYRLQGSRWLILPYSQSILARQLNIEPETLSRLLTKFRKHELLSVSGKECVLLNPQALCDEVNLPADTFAACDLSARGFRCCGL